MRWDRDGSKTSTRSPSPSIHSGMADVVQAFDIIQAFMRLTAVSHLREPRALNEPVCPCRSSCTTNLGSLALAAVALYKTFSARSRCLGHYVAAGGASYLAKLFERLESHELVRLK
jgi:hypothetical protein